MATFQTDYSLRRAKGLPGQVSSEEKSNRVSRTVESSAGIAFGQPAFRGSGDNGVVVGASFAGTGTGTAVAGNTGTGTITASPTITAGAKEGNYSVVIIEPGTNAGVFEVTDPDGVFVGRGTVAVAFSAGGVAFTVADGGTDFVSGDAFNIAVAFTANADFLGIAILNPAVPANASTPDAYPQYFTGAFMTMGTIYVTAGATVAQGDDVYWNPSTKRFTNTTTHVRIPHAKFEGAAVDTGIVEISLNLR
jgi:hypothetical protein